MKEYIMKTTRKIGFIPVILLCAVFVIVPMVAAAGPGQGTNQHNNQGPGGFSQGPAQEGSMNQSQGRGQGGMMMPDNGQNSNTGTDQNAGNSNAPGGPPDGNFGNTTGNMIMPDPGDGNMTTFGNVTWHGQGRMTAGNMTFCQSPLDSNVTATGNWTAPDNMTMCQPGGERAQSIPGDNLTVPNQAGGNMTIPKAPPDNGNANGPQNQNGQNAGTDTQSVQQQGTSMTQAQSQDQNDSTLIEEFLKWLRGQSGSSS